MKHTNHDHTTDIWKIYKKRRVLNGCMRRATGVAGAGMRQAVSLLQRAGSSYLPPFLSLRDTIMHEAAVAEDNLAALGCLEEPCLALHKALPQVKSLLPGCS